MENYQEQDEITDKEETIKALKPAIAEMKDEKGEPAEVVFAELTKLNSQDL